MHHVGDGDLSRRGGLDARVVEQVGDDLVGAAHLVVNHRERLRHVALGRGAHGELHEVRGVLDRSEGVANLVGNGARELAHHGEALAAHELGLRGLEGGGAVVHAALELVVGHAQRVFGHLERGDVVNDADDVRDLSAPVAHGHLRGGQHVALAGAVGDALLLDTHHLAAGEHLLVAGAKVVGLGRGKEIEVGAPQHRLARSAQHVGDRAVQENEAILAVFDEDRVRDVIDDGCEKLKATRPRLGACTRRRSSSRRRACSWSPPASQPQRRDRRAEHGAVRMPQRRPRAARASAAVGRLRHAAVERRVGCARVGWARIGFARIGWARVGYAHVGCARRPAVGAGHRRDGHAPLADAGRARRSGRRACRPRRSVARRGRTRGPRPRSARSARCRARARRGTGLRAARGESARGRSRPR